MFTRIENLRQRTIHCGFIPPHGRDLIADEAVVIDGDLRTVLAGGRGRYGRKTEIAGLDAAVAAGDIAVVAVHEAPPSSTVVSVP